MKKTVITADSGVIISDKRIPIIPLFIIDHDTGKTYRDQDDITIEEVYALRLEGHRITTSCVNLAEAEDHFRKQLEEADQIVHLCMSSKISEGSLVAVNQAAAEVAPDRIRIVNTLQGPAGGAIIARKAMQMIEQEDNLDAIAQYLCERIVPHVKTSFIVPDPAGYKISGKGILNGFINLGLSAFSAGSGIPAIRFTSGGSMLPIRKIRAARDRNMYVEFFKGLYDPALMEENFIAVSSLAPEPERLEALREYIEALPDAESYFDTMGTTISAFACRDSLGISYLGKA